MKKCILVLIATVALLLVIAIGLVYLIFPQPNGIDGYVDRTSYSRGDTARVFVSSRSDSSTLRLFDVEGNVVDRVDISPQNQRISHPEPWRNGFGWDVSLRYAIDLPSGIYLWENRIPMVVRSPRADLDLLVVYPSNTIAAYNRTGGRSLYGPSRQHRVGLFLEDVVSLRLYGLPDHAENRATSVSFRRPGNTEKWSFFRPFLKWLARQDDLAVGYVSDQDMDVWERLAGADILVIMGHSEYWTREAREHFDAHVAQGGSALVLSGNTMWWQVRYSPDGQRLICYRTSELDPVQDTLRKTINWVDPTLRYPVDRSIGAHFGRGGYGTTEQDAGWDGYKIIAPDSPLLRDVSLPDDSILSIPTLEFDGAPLLWEVGRPTLDLDHLDAYRGELIGYDLGYRDGEQTVGTFFVYQRSPDSGVVVNAGSTNWCSTSGIGGADSLAIQQITRNAIDLLLEEDDVFSSPPG